MPSILTIKDACGELREPHYVSENSTAGIMLACFIAGLTLIVTSAWIKLDITAWVSFVLSAIITFTMVLRYWVYYYDTTRSPISGIFKKFTPAIRSTQYLLDVVIVLLVGSAIVFIFANLIVGWFAFQAWLALMGSVYALNYLRCIFTLNLLESGDYEQLFPSYKNTDAATKNRIKELFSHWKNAIPIYSLLFYFALFLSFFDGFRYLSLIVTTLIVVYYIIKFATGKDLFIDFKLA